MVNVPYSICACQSEVTYCVAHLKFHPESM